MHTWEQIYTPLGSLRLSALAAGIPFMFFFAALAALRMKGHMAAAVTLALGVAIFAYAMPAGQALAAAADGFAYGMWPIAWIIVSVWSLHRSRPCLPPRARWPPPC
ncbi:L-lactate permease [Oxalobacteraceae bacterium GrIS 1.11]